MVKLYATTLVILLLLSLTLGISSLNDTKEAKTSTSSISETYESPNG